MAKTKMIKSNVTKTNKNKTRKNWPTFAEEIAVKFLEMTNNIKLYHWNTYSYATHKATDNLYSQLGELADKFMEVFMGKYETRINLVKKSKCIVLKNIKTHDEFKRLIEEYKSYMVSLDNNKALATMSNTDLFNIRDEILGNLNQFLYLYTMK
jgi:hypothetical protein